MILGLLGFDDYAWLWWLIVLKLQINIIYLEYCVSYNFLNVWLFTESKSEVRKSSNDEKRRKFCILFYSNQLLTER